MLAGTQAWAFTGSETAAAKTAILDVDQGKWDAAYAVADDAHFPLLTKLVTWMDLTRSGTGADFPHLRSFIQENPDWPQQNTLRRHAEDAITESTPPAENLFLTFTSTSVPNLRLSIKRRASDLQFLRVPRPASDRRSAPWMYRRRIGGVRPRLPLRLRRGGHR